MEIDELLITWYLHEKRDLPWRRTTDPYRIWLSEIILQQTRVEQGKPYYLRFVNAYPEIGILAESPEDKVLKLWQGLGYYSRARNLHFTAKYIHEQLGGEFPRSYEEIRKLKGVGPYTAAAVASFAFRLPHAVVDGNVSRVISRVFDISEPINASAGKKQIERLARACLNRERPDLFNQAIMELGALVCKPKNPGCMICPLQAKCLALKNGTVRERPVKLPKSSPKRRRIDYAVIESEEHLLMRKRLEKDIWKGLYDFASIENESNPVSSETMIDFVEATFPGLAVHTVDSAPHKSYTHLLSHRKIEANFWRLRVKGVCEEGSPYVRVNKAEVADFAVPKLIHRFLSESEII